MLSSLRLSTTFSATITVKRCLPSLHHIRALSDGSSSQTPEEDTSELPASNDEVFTADPAYASRTFRSAEHHQRLEISPSEDPLLRYLSSALIRDGKAAHARRSTAHTLTWIHALTRAPPLPIFREAILQVAPAVKCTVRRQGAKTTAKPMALGEKQRVKFAVKWLLDASKSKIGRTIEERLAREVVAVVQGNSAALKKKEEVHTFAMVNRGNASHRA